MRRRCPGSRLLDVISRLVPRSHRDEWLAEWNGEIANAWAQRSDSDARVAMRLRIRCLGAFVDALWIRRHSTITPRRSSMFAHDVRYAARSLSRKPGFTAVVVGTLALCIGANTAIFSVVNSVLLHGLPYRDLDRLVAIWSNDTESKQSRNSVSIGDYRDMRRDAISKSRGAHSVLRRASSDAAIVARCAVGGSRDAIPAVRREHHDRRGAGRCRSDVAAASRVRLSRRGR